MKKILNINIDINGLIRSIINCIKNRFYSNRIEICVKSSAKEYSNYFYARNLTGKTVKLKFDGFTFKNAGFRSKNPLINSSNDNLEFETIFPEETTSLHEVNPVMLQYLSEDSLNDINHNGDIQVFFENEFGHTYSSIFSIDEVLS